MSLTPRPFFLLQLLGIIFGVGMAMVVTSEEKSQSLRKITVNPSTSEREAANISSEWVLLSLYLVQPQLLAAVVSAGIQALSSHREPAPSQSRGGTARRARGRGRNRRRDRATPGAGRIRVQGVGNLTAAIAQALRPTQAY